MQDYFRSIGKILTAEFDASDLIHHRGSKGRVRERSLERHLEKILPYRFGLGHGEIRSSNGSISTECDLIIYDKLNCPIIFNDEETQVFPIESVYAIIEVKSWVSTKHLIEFSNKMGEIRDQDRFNRTIPPNIIQQLKSMGIITGNTWKGEPVPFGLFIGLKGIKLDTALEALNTHYKKVNSSNVKHPSDWIINSTCIMNKGIITQLDPKTSTTTKT